MTQSVIVQRVATAVPITTTGGTPLEAALTPSVAHTLTGSPPATQVVYAGAATYRGFTLRETTVTTRATVVVYDNAAGDATGSILDTIALSPGECNTVEHPGGRSATAGVSVVIAGTVQGALFLAA